MRRIHRNSVLVTFLFVVLASTALWAEERVTLISDTFSRTGDLPGTNPEVVAPELGTLTWQKPTGSNVGKDMTNGSQVTTGSGTASVLSAEALYGKTLVISSDITINTTSGASGTGVARGLGLGFFGTLDTPTSGSTFYNRYGFSGVIIYPGTSPAAGTVYYGTYNKSTNQLNVTTGSAISDYSAATAYNLSYKIALSRDGQSAVISDVKVGDNAMFPEGTTFNVATNETNATGTNYLGIISSSGAVGTSGNVDNFKVEQSYGTVTSGNETVFNANTAFDIKVTSGTTLNVAMYLNEQDINPASGEFYLAGKGWNNTARIYLDSGSHPTNYTQIDEGAIVVGGLSSDRSIYPNIVIDATEGATISKVGFDASLTGRLILKGNLTGGKLTTFGIRQASVTVLDGDVSLAGINVATGTLQFNSTDTKIDSKTVYLTDGINVEKGAILAPNRYGTFEIRKSKDANAELGTITLNDSTLKSGAENYEDWNLKSNLTINGASTIDYGGNAYSILLQGATLHGDTNASLQIKNITGGGFILQNGSKLTGTLEFKGAAKLRIDSGATLEGDLTISGGTVHFYNGSATDPGMTATSAITMTGGALQIDNGKLQGNVTIQDGSLNSNVNFQAGTLTFTGTKNNINNGKNITMTGGELILQNSAKLTTGTVTLNGGSIEAQGTGTKIGTLVLSKDGTISHTQIPQGSAYTFTVDSISGTNNKLTYKPTEISILAVQDLNVKEFNYECGGKRGVVNINSTAVMGANGLTKTGSGTADFHVYDGATVSVADGVTDTQIASGINTRLIGTTTFDIGQDQKLTIKSPVLSTTGSTTQQLHKTGAGTLVLNGANTYVTTTEGLIYSTFVEGGTLVVNGSLADDVQVLSGGTLATGTSLTPGSLAITGTLDVSGTVSLGLFDAGTDSITTTQGVAFHDGSNLAIDLTGLSDADTRDNIPITGLSAFTSDIPLDDLVSVTGSFTNWIPVILGETLTLTRSSEVPEPASWLLLLLAAGGIVTFRKRK